MDGGLFLNVIQESKLAVSKGRPPGLADKKWHIIYGWFLTKERHIRWKEADVGDKTRLLIAL